MIKATIQNSPYCTEMRFPCSETELSRKLGEIKMNPEHLAPMATVIDIEPVELSMLTDCDVSLDALNFLGKRMDGMGKAERDQFLAVLSSDEIGIGCSLKNVINLTYNLERFTLIEDTDDLESVGRTHILNVRGYISESESNNHEWLSEQGVKLLESGSGIETDYGKIFINKDVPFKEVFNGTTFPAYYCEMNSVAEIAIEYNNLIELVELPCEDITIKKALCRLGADGLKDCKILVDSTRDITDEWSERISEVEKTKDLFGLNTLLKTEDILLKQEKPESIFKKEISRRLSEEGYNFSFENGEFAITLSGGDVVKIRENDVLYSNGDFSEVGKDTFYALYHLNREVLNYCSAYEKATPLVADGLSGNYRWSAYNAELGEDNTIIFNTAWSRAMPVIQKLAENFPDLNFEYCWADEDLGVNTGMAEFENGEVTFDEFYNAHSRDAYELAADLWNLDLAEEGYVFNEETRSYDYRPDEPDESPKME